MIEFKLSAPSKVILFGEHAVVYGKTAVAASIDLRTTADFIVPLGTEQTVSISFPNVELSVTIPMTRIKNFLSDNSLLQSIDDHDALYKNVQQFIQLDLMDLITQQNCVTNPQKILSLEVLFYLLAYISKKEKINVEPFRIHLKFCLSVNSGAGSSASFAVCLAACFLHWSHLQKNMQKAFDTNDLETISKYAFMGEKIIHGSPSGIDNFVCTYGSIIEYKKNAYMKPMPAVENMRILLVDTGVTRTTKALVERLADLRCKYPTIIDPILESIDNVSKEALKVITKLQELPKDDEASFCNAYKQLMTLVNINQSLLCACKVSHPSLDKICATARKYELAGKLTGAGGGGYSYILLSPDTTSETIKCIFKKLTDDGFSVVLTTLGCTGVKIHN